MYYDGYDFSYNHTQKDIDWHTPPWWKAIEKCEQKNSDGARIFCNFDHSDRVRETDIFVAQPYNLRHDHVIAISQLCERYHLISHITSRSPHLPGRTVAVYLHATERTYCMLQIPAVTEDTLGLPIPVWDEFKELTGETKITIWHKTAERVSLCFE